MSVWALLLAFLLSWLSTLSGVALGGFLVYRTKRDAYDPLFRATEPKGESFHIADGFTDQGGQGPVTPEEINSMFGQSGPSLAANERFMEQFSDDLTQTVAETRRNIKDVEPNEVTRGA